MTTPSNTAVLREATTTWSRVARRAVVGVAILTVTVAGAAWLLHATIDPAEEARAAAAGQQAGPGIVRTTENR